MQCILERNEKLKDNIQVFRPSQTNFSVVHKSLYRYLNIITFTNGFRASPRFLTKHFREKTERKKLKIIPTIEEFF